MTRRQQLKAQKCSRVKETTSAAPAAAMTALWDENIYYKSLIKSSVENIKYILVCIYVLVYEFIKLLSFIQDLENIIIINFFF